MGKDHIHKIYLLYFKHVFWWVQQTMHSKISSALKQQICAQYMLFVCLQTLAMQNKSKHNFAGQSNVE